MLLRRPLAALVISGALAACMPAVGPAHPTPPRDAPAQGKPASAPPSALQPFGSDTSASLLAEGFVVLAEKSGVTVYRREKLPGIELAAEGDFAAPPERVRRVLLDYPNHQSWQKRLAENRVLGRGADFLDVYQRLHLPVVDDRDFTLHVTWGNDGEALWMHFLSAPERGPAEVPGVVRVKVHEGRWRLAPSPGGTHGVYRFHMDLAGSFPTFMARGAVSDEVPEIFEQIRRRLPSYASGDGSQGASAPRAEGASPPGPAAMSPPGEVPVTAPAR